MTNFDFQNAYFSSNNKIIYIVGNGCSETGKKHCAKYGAYLLSYDIESKKITNAVIFNEKKRFLSVISDKNQIFVAGTKSIKIAENQNHHDMFLSCYQKSGKKLWETDYNYSNHEDVFDMKLIRDTIHIVGNSLGSDGEKFFHLKYNLQGQLYSNKVDGNINTENRLTKIYEYPHQGYIILGSSHSWRVFKE